MSIMFGLLFLALTTAAIRDPSPKGGLMASSHFHIYKSLAQNVPMMKGEHYNYYYGEWETDSYDGEWIDEDSWDEEYYDDELGEFLVIIIVWMTFAPLVFLLGLLGFIPACVYQCPGGGDCTHCSRSCWACANLTFGIIDLVITFASLFMVAFMSYGGLHWMVFLFFAPTLGHFFAYRNLRSQVQSSPPVNFPQHVPTNVQQVSYCPTCSGPFVPPANRPPTVICPRCNTLISMTPPAQAAVPMAVLVRPPAEPGQPGLQQPGLQQPGLQRPGLQQPGLQQPGPQYHPHPAPSKRNGFQPLGSVDDLDDAAVV